MKTAGIVFLHPADTARVAKLAAESGLSTAAMAARLLSRQLDIELERLKKAMPGRGGAPHPALPEAYGKAP